MRTFQFSDAKSHKFWQIDVSGASFTVTYGKVGTAGQTQTKSFPTPEKAQAAAASQIAEAANARRVRRMKRLSQGWGQIARPCATLRTQ